MKIFDRFIAIFICILVTTPFAATQGAGLTDDDDQNKDTGKWGEVEPNKEVPADWYHIAGAYRLFGKADGDDQPTWATAWKPDYKANQFVFYIWPPVYCHAIYICEIPGVQYDTRNHFLQIKEDTCLHNTIKYYPQAQKIGKIGAAGSDWDFKYYSENTITFTKDRAAGKVKVNVYKKKPTDRKDFENPETEVFEFENAKDKNYLVLTNSRMCRVSIPGEMFYPLLVYNNLDDNEKGKLLTVIHPQDFTNYPSPFIPSLGGKAKSIDLLPGLKEAGKKFKTPTGPIKKRCLNYRKGGLAGTNKNKRESSAVISARSYYVEEDTSDTDNVRVKKFTIGFNNCHWARIGVSTTHKTAQEFVDNLDLKNTIDLFFNEAFYVPPQTDEAKQLPGMDEIDSIEFFTHIDPAPGQKNTKDLVEMKFGYHAGVKTYSEFIKLKVLDETTKYHLHIFASPFCEVDMDMSLPPRQSSQNIPYFNYLRVKECEYTELLA